jgi:hypothetical protein
MTTTTELRCGHHEVHGYRHGGLARRREADGDQSVRETLANCDSALNERISERTLVERRVGCSLELVEATGSVCTL